VADPIRYIHKFLISLNNRVNLAMSVCPLFEFLDLYYKTILY